jgi:hypothetical protein
MSNRKERRQILRSMGLLNVSKKDPFDNKVKLEEGKNKHRLHLQRVKNEQIQKENKKDTDNDFFIYRQQESEYSSFQSMLMKRDWDSLESNDDNARN